MQEKTERLKAHAIRGNEDFLDRSHEKLAQERPKNVQDKWQRAGSPEFKRNKLKSVTTFQHLVGVQLGKRQR